MGARVNNTVHVEIEVVALWVVVFYFVSNEALVFLFRVERGCLR